MQGCIMKLVLIHKGKLRISSLIISSIWSQVLILFSLSFLLVSCFAQQSYIGRTAMPKHVLSMSADTDERIWQTNEIILNYQVIEQEGGGAFALSGSLSVLDSITRTFPTVKMLKFRIHYLDEKGQVISTHPIGINHGYKNKLAKNLKLIGVPSPPTEAVSFTFSYFGIMAGFGIADENPGEWEIYFDPFKDSDGNDQPTKDLFYRE